jgi:hypothetical protein
MLTVEGCPPSPPIVVPILGVWLTPGMPAGFIFLDQIARGLRCAHSGRDGCGNLEGLPRWCQNDWPLFPDALP